MALHKQNLSDDAPFLMKSKRDGKCAECRTDILEGDDIYWDPKEQKAYCIECGEEL